MDYHFNKLWEAPVHQRAYPLALCAEENVFHITEDKRDVFRFYRHRKENSKLGF